MFSTALIALAICGASQPDPFTDNQLARGPFGVAQAALSRGRLTEGIRRLEGALERHPNNELAVRARRLLGLAYLETNNHRKAASLFGQLAAQEPDEADTHLFRRGQALFRWKSYLDAAEALSAVSSRSSHGAEAERLRARSLFLATDYSGLAQWLENLERQRGRLDVELLLLLGRAQERVSGPAKAAPRLKRAWFAAERPAVVVEALRAWVDVAPAERWPSPAARLARGLRAPADNAKYQDIDRGFARLSRALRRYPIARAELEMARGRIAEQRRRFRTASGHYAEANSLAQRAGASDVRAHSAVGVGRIAFLRGRTKDALRYFEQASQGEGRAREEALERASTLYLLERRYAEGRDRCVRLLHMNPVSPFRSACLWNAGWAHFRLGSHQRAEEFFKSLVGLGRSGEPDARARYWLSRSRERQGKIAEAQKGYAEILRRYPLSFYAALSEARMVVPVESEAVATKAQDPLPAELVRAKNFLKLGNLQAAHREVEAFRRAYQGSGRISESAYATWSALLWRFGDRIHARRVREAGARAHPGALANPVFLEAARRRNPLEFEPEIRAAAREFGLPAPLLFALVRTESGFKVNAVSAMRAYGLAQLILPTARSVARRIKAGPVSRYRLLTRPDLNVRLGAAYLQELLELYGGSEPMALAAYNAGPDALDAWTRRRLRRVAGVKGRGLGLSPDDDEMAEEIPVAETRAFVKAVLSRARAYAHLYPEPEVVPDPIALAPTQGGAALVEPSVLPAAADTPYVPKEAVTVRHAPLWEGKTTRATP